MAYRQIRVWSRNDVEGFGCAIEVRNQNEGICIEGDYIYTIPASELEERRRLQPNSYGMVVDAQAILGIYEQNAGGLNNYVSYLVLVTGSSLVGRVLNDTLDICKLSTVSFLSLQRRGSIDDDQASDLKKLLQSGDFYFAVPSQSTVSNSVSYNLIDQPGSSLPRFPSWDLTRSIQNTVLRIDELNDEFAWNRSLFSPLTRFGVRVESLCVRIICGYVEMRTVYAADLQLRVALISRISAARCGARFSVRGANEFGDVANFVETEQVIFAGSSIVSHLQLRGTVPLIWEQPGFQVGSHRVRLPRSAALSLAAFDRHVARLVRAYAPPNSGPTRSPSSNNTGGLATESNTNATDRANLNLNLQPASTRYATKLRLLLLSLLQNQKDEGVLTRAYLDHFNVLRSRYDELFEFIAFDYHDQLKRFGQRALDTLLSKLRIRLGEFSLFFFEGSNSAQPTVDPSSFSVAADAATGCEIELAEGLRGRVVRIQNGLVRTNCLDCLDRTNATQTLVGIEMIATMLACLVPTLRYVKDPQSLLVKLNDAYRQLWLQNGDRISHVYAGTGAIGTQSKLKDVQRSAARTIKNNFLDDSRQTMIDNLLYTASRLEPRVLQKAQALLGNRALSLSFDTTEQVIMRRWQFCEPLPIRVWTGTWNVNGGKHFRSVAHKNESISDWLVDVARITRETRPDLIDPLFDESVLTHDIYAVGFEEIVDLNAQNVMRASESNQREWERYLLDLLNAAEPNRKEAFKTLQTVQLVGICMCVFVRADLLPHIRDVQVAQVKTGLSGTAGNKGAVSVRFQLHTSTLCFVCAHFAAGQSNVKERNSDFTDVLQRTSFTADRRILDHDAIFWFGDFNYRIDMSREELLRFVTAGDWESLRKYDQLTRERLVTKNAFQQFEEALPNFAPTYKYDLFSNEYDSSEKCRVPAWCDRVLFRSQELPLSKDVEKADREVADAFNEALSLQLYNRVELKTSDHRPVCAIFSLNVFRVDREKRRTVLRDILLTGPNDRTVLVNSSGPVSEEQLLNHFRKFGDIGTYKFYGPESGSATRCRIAYKHRSSASNAFKAHANPLDSPTRGGAGNSTVFEVRYRNEEWNKEIDRAITRTLLSEPQENGAASTPVLNELASCLTGFEDSDALDSQPLAPTALTDSVSLSTARSASNLTEFSSADDVSQRSSTPVNLETGTGGSKPAPARPPPPRPAAPPKRPDRPPPMSDLLAANTVSADSAAPMHPSRSTNALLEFSAEQPMSSMITRGGSEKQPQPPLFDLSPMERSQSVHATPQHVERPPRPANMAPQLDVDALLSFGEDQQPYSQLPAALPRDTSNGSLRREAENGAFGQSSTDWQPPAPLPRGASSGSLRRDPSDSSLKQQPLNDGPPPPPPVRPRPPPRALPSAPIADNASSSPTDLVGTNVSSPRDDRASVASDVDPTATQDSLGAGGVVESNQPRVPPPAPPRRKLPPTPP